MTNTDLLIDGPADATWTLVLAHGAGQNMRSGFMNHFATGLADAGQCVGGLRVVRFEFPYMARGQKEGVRRPPDREPVLLDSWHSVLATLRESGTARNRTVIGGKSLGARMASLICNGEQVAGLVCLGYPFHPPGKTDPQRIAHLRTVTAPTLICQGERDTFGNRKDVADYDLPGNIRVHWLIDGDHGFKPRMASGRSEVQNWQESIETIVDFIRGLL
jgi:predicted alpha/beta-hydrolase family hydrolase